ncbi:MAG TPA: FAD:protein FMN transferase [Thermomicrobiales bacterium]|jgi:thiamine biosynthesis lipoprotein|nr:FAD:protein FMN transferase [Thermomicrobiales bacterium]
MVSTATSGGWSTAFVATAAASGQRDPFHSSGAMTKAHLDEIPAQRLCSAHFSALGTRVDVLVTRSDELEPVLEHVRQIFDLVDRTFSRFRTDSELARLDWLPGTRQSASAMFLALLDAALRAARDTGGWFDPTVRDALEAAGYDRSFEQIESEGASRRRRPVPAGRWDEITYDRDRLWVHVPEGVRLDFGGIGKGFAVDEALRTMPPVRGGVLINAGGDLAVRGDPPVDGWRISVSEASHDRIEMVVALHAGALATSGLGHRTWTRDGVQLHHLIDPRTGAPASIHWRSVTVAARDCAAAEVAAKAAWLMGAAGPAWLVGRGLTGRFAATDGRVETAGSWPTVGSREESIHA